MKRVWLLTVVSVMTCGLAAAQDVRPMPVPPAPFVVAPSHPMPVGPIPMKFDVALDLDDVHVNIGKLEHDLQAQAMHLQDQAVAIASQAVVAVRGSQQDADYQSGLSLLQQRRYDRAIETFGRVIARKDDRADAALYWKAFAEFKLAQTDNALASLAQLRKEYTASRYLADAKVLEADVKRVAGQPAPPAAADDDEIKLLAIQGLSRTSEAITLLEGVLSASNSLSVKRRALYVLALNEDPRANDILMRYARGAGNPDLQIEAIRYLGQRGNRVSEQVLVDLYGATSDIRVKLALVDALKARGSKDALLKLSTDKALSMDLKPALLGRLGGMLSADEVMQLYRQETDASMRMQLLSILGVSLSAEQLGTIARSDADVRVRARAVRQFSAIAGRDPKASQVLVDLYQTQTDRDVRRAIIDTLSAQGTQGRAEALVTLARRESDLELKRELVRRISALASSSKVAADYLMEQLR